VALYVPIIPIYREEQEADRSSFLSSGFIPEVRMSFALARDRGREERY